MPTIQITVKTSPNQPNIDRLCGQRRKEFEGRKCTINGNRCQGSRVKAATEKKTSTCECDDKIGKKEINEKAEKETETEEMGEKLINTGIYEDRKIRRSTRGCQAFGQRSENLGG